jgi:hypothetical protein
MHDITWAELEAQYDKRVAIEDMLGVTITSIDRAAGTIPYHLDFHTDKGLFAMGHIQDCCESVYLNDVDGDLDDLIGSPITLAECVGSWSGHDGEWDKDAPPGVDVKPKHYDSSTWTFYKLGNSKVSMTLRWVGESNGYYSERVDIIHIPETQDE